MVETDSRKALTFSDPTSALILLNRARASSRGSFSVQAGESVVLLVDVALPSLFSSVPLALFALSFSVQAGESAVLLLDVNLPWGFTAAPLALLFSNLGGIVVDDGDTPYLMGISYLFIWSLVLGYLR